VPRQEENPRAVFNNANNSDKYLFPPNDKYLLEPRAQKDLELTKIFSLALRWHEKKEEEKRGRQSAR
jgi:hypothetical protein